MQLLQIHAEFMLPDDFNGTLSDALRELAEYNDSAKSKDRLKSNGKEDKFITILDWEIQSLKTLAERNKEDGTRTAMSYFVGEYID